MNFTTKTTKRSEPDVITAPDISKSVVDGIFRVHSVLGPGLLESTYEKCLVHELSKRGLKVSAQKTLPVQYDDLFIDAGYKVDLLIDDSLIIELKAVEKIIPIHRAQIMTYLKLSGLKTGLLVNFNSKLIRDGIQRISI